MPEEQARSTLPGGGGENRAEEPSKTVYFVPIYAVAAIDPNKHGKSRLPLDDQRQWNVGSIESVSDSQRGFKGMAAEPEVAVEQKRQKLIVMRKRGRIPEYDDEDPRKPTPKRLRNRMKAQKSRDKKKAYVNSLENKVKELGKMNSELEERCLSLQIENEALKNEAITPLSWGKHKMHIAQGVDTISKKFWSSIWLQKRRCRIIVRSFERVKKISSRGLPRAKEVLQVQGSLLIKQELERSAPRSMTMKMLLRQSLMKKVLLKPHFMIKNVP